MSTRDPLSRIRREGPPLPTRGVDAEESELLAPPPGAALKSAKPPAVSQSDLSKSRPSPKPTRTPKNNSNAKNDSNAKNNLK